MNVVHVHSYLSQVVIGCDDDVKKEGGDDDEDAEEDVFASLAPESPEEILMQVTTDSHQVCWIIIQQWVRSVDSPFMHETSVYVTQLKFCVNSNDNYCRTLTFT